jgi:RpiB/LacA/LacB family sugar-phosphate isomerase
MIYLGADHRGFELKEKLKVFLEKEGYEFEDLGNTVLNPKDDYPDFGAKVARKVAEDPDRNRGVLFCGSGLGMSIVANRFKDVRCVLIWTDDEALIKQSRKHGDTNVLSLPADYLTEEQAKKIVNLWLETPFSGEERHRRRLQKIESL